MDYSATIPQKSILSNSHEDSREGINNRGKRRGARERLVIMAINITLGHLSTITVCIGSPREKFQSNLCLAHSRARARARIGTKDAISDKTKKKTTPRVRGRRDEMQERGRKNSFTSRAEVDTGGGKKAILLYESEKGASCAGH